ncbi:hypothetical protein LWI28_016256 [Acer negundo]|uniref:Retrotransposon Copia-like N-terminal domain-containing protein n=1 Tax=Acer negundo TaxID=4023 RepID=A0AAD5JPI7_ACENE|nr:hypothetical protein LWI28_016256 [Acer negundo]
MSETSKTITTAQSEEVIFGDHGGKPSELQNIHPTYRLNGQNYLKWSQMVQTFLKGKGKLSHLLGTGPQKGDPKFEDWDEKESLVMSWLWNSMTPEISDTCMFLTTAKDIWESTRQTYSKIKDAAQVYEIKAKISDAKQILGREELPSLNEAISMVRAEESRRSVMLEPQTSEGSAMVSNSSKSRSLNPEQQSDLSKTSNRDTIWCTYCKKPRHTKERYWKLIGKPSTSSREWGYKGGQFKTQGQANWTAVQPNQETGESVIEDKDRDCFPLDLSLEPAVISSKTAAVPFEPAAVPSEPADISIKTAAVPKPATIPSISKPAIVPAQPETVPLPHQRPPNSNVEPVTKDNTVLDSMRYMQVYSRRKIPEPVQVQDSEPDSVNEVTVISDPVSDFDLP